MTKTEARIIDRVEIIKNWFSEIIGGNYILNNRLALNLLEELEEEDKKWKK